MNSLSASFSGTNDLKKTFALKYLIASSMISSSSVDFGAGPFFDGFENFKMKISPKVVNRYTVKTPIKRPSHFQFLEEMSLNFEMSLNYKKSNSNTFCGISCLFRLFLPYY